jgi:IclR family transcriptional regulator, pca regulon regulatory protein
VPERFATKSTAETSAVDSGACGKMPQGEYVLSLERGLAVIRSLSEENRRATLAEVSRATGLSRAAARRFLLSLQALRYVESDGRYFTLHRRVLALGYAYLSSLPWWQDARQVAGKLAIDFGSDAIAGVLDGGSVVYVVHASPSKFSVFNQTEGTKAPTYATAVGRVILAGLDNAQLETFLAAADLRSLTPLTITDPKRLRRTLEGVRREGFSIVNQELDLGQSSIAVPLFDSDGHVVAGLGLIYARSESRNADFENKALEALKAASCEISK